MFTNNDMFSPVYACFTHHSARYELSCGHSLTEELFNSLWTANQLYCRTICFWCLFLWVCLYV